MKPDMFASNNSTEINQIVLDHVSPSSMEEPQQNSYLHFPDPFLDDDDLFLSHFLSGQQQLFSGGDCWEEREQEQEHVHDQTKQNSDKARIEVMKKKKKCSSNRKIGSSTKRTGKKDRHSKICTAQGPRDRRMRLSLQIARKFFDLQDMLGFDKASKTIEWLLSNSNSAIKDLKDSLNNNNNISGHSYGSVCSGSSEVVSEIIRDNNIAGGGATAKEAAFMGTLKDKKSRPLRTVARESRDRARARARQRTMLKKTEQQQQPQPISYSEDQNPCFDFQHVNSELQEQTHFQDCPTIKIDHKVFAISDDLSDFPSIHSFFSGNNNTQLQNLDYPTFSCPNSIFMASPIPKPYSFSDTTLLKLP